jgi:hypothetical protein
MRLPKRRLKARRSTHIAVAWYDPVQYERLREVASDPENLDDSFDDWHRGATRVLAELESKGTRVEKVPVDIEALVRWCREQARPVDGPARAEYAAMLGQESQESRSGKKRS